MGDNPSFESTSTSTYAPIDGAPHTTITSTCPETSHASTSPETPHSSTPAIVINGHAILADDTGQAPGIAINGKAVGEGENDAITPELAAHGGGGGGGGSAELAANGGGSAELTASGGRLTPEPSSSPNPSKKKSVDDFEFGEVIGEGSFGEVRIAEDKVTKVRYAAKILHKAQIVKENKVKYVSSEKGILDQLRHANIVRLFFTFQTKVDLYYILELCPSGELLHLIKQAGRFDEPTAKFYGAELLSAIAHMHGKGIAHRDIKPENVLLDPSMHAKLSDFGSAKEIPLGGRSQSFVGTAEYVCPELLLQRAAGHPADMWSFGVMLYQMLTGKLPFKGMNEFQVFQEITKNEYDVPSFISESAKDLLSKLLVSDPVARLDAVSAKSHAFFSGTDWDALETTTPPVVPKREVTTPPPPEPIEGQQGTPPIHKKSPKPKIIISPEKRNSSPSSPSSAVSSSSSPFVPLRGSMSARNPRSFMPSSVSSPQLSILFLNANGRLQSPDSRSRARASSEFAEPPTFVATSPSDHSRWATFLTANERIVDSGVVQLRKSVFFSRRKLFLFITDKRLALVDPTTWVATHEYIWGYQPITAVIRDHKSFTLTTGNKVRVFEVDKGQAKQWVDLVQYFATMHRDQTNQESVSKKKEKK